MNLCTQSTAILYDASFDGLLTAIFEATRLHIQPSRIIAEERYEAELFEEIHAVTTDANSAERVWNALEKRAGRDCAGMLRGAFLSEIPGIEMDIWHYQRKLFADKSGMYSQNILDEHAHKLLQTANKVKQEAHLLTGFVRFQTTQQGISFAAVEPTYNVVELLAPHFCNRFPNQDWLIVDARRGCAIHYEHGELRSVHLTPSDLPLMQGSLKNELIDEDELRFRDLWKTYHVAINIKERRNIRLMTRLLPRKYWKYLPEKASSFV